MKQLTVAFTFMSAVVSFSDDCQPASDPSRIAVAGGSVTEVLYFLELQSLLVGVDTTSNFPVVATELPSIGYVRNLSAEGLLSLKPTLILGEDDMGPPTVIKQLEGTGVETRSVAEQKDAAGIIEKVKCIANIVHAEQSADSVFQARLNELQTTRNAIDNLPPLDRSVALLLMFDGGSSIAGGDNTSAGGFLSMLRANNTFANVDGWKPISSEFMAKANPDVLLITARGARQLGNVDDIVNHPILAVTNAGIKQDVFVIDGMAMLGFGPRTLSVALEMRETIESRSGLAQAN